MPRESEETSPSGPDARQAALSRLAASLRDPATRLIVGVAVLGSIAFVALLAVFGPEPWPLLPWLGLTAACGILVSFPYRVNRPGGSYSIDFDEMLLVISLLYVGPAATLGVLVVGYLLGASVRGTPAERMLFNAGTRAIAVAVSLALVSELPVPAVHPWDYLVSAVVAAALYTLINQALVSWIIALVNGSSYLEEFRDACAEELVRAWPVVVSYGLLVGVASEALPVVLLLAGIPVAVLVASSRTSQKRRNEHERMRGLYRAAQELHEARTDEDVIHILRRSVSDTLGVDGTMLRSDPPFGEELGAWLPNRGSWVIVPAPVSPETRRQDEAFLQALASLVDAGMERATLVGELERQSLRDPLTNCFNRRYFHQALSKALEGAEHTPGCLALLDIDHFKSINDSFGHEVGDSTLKELVGAVGETFRGDDVLCRLGGDEFALILPGLTPSLAAERLELLRRRLSELRPGEPGRGPIGFGMSVGVAPYPQHGIDPAELLRSADQALYRAKREGRDRVIVLGTTSAPGITPD